LGSILGGKIEAKATKSPSKIEAVLGRRKKMFFKNCEALFWVGWWDSQATGKTLDGGKNLGQQI
jgi:hypothetical protein